MGKHWTKCGDALRLGSKDRKPYYPFVAKRMRGGCSCVIPR